MMFIRNKTVRRTTGAALIVVGALLMWFATEVAIGIGLFAAGVGLEIVGIALERRDGR